MTDDADAREQLSEMTGITERTIRRSLYPDARLDELYRDCPTAFWLAPDADLSIPHEPPVPAQQIVIRFDSDAAGAITVEGRSTGVFAALIAAGPVFTAVAFALSGAGSTNSWWEPLAMSAGSVVLAPLTVPVGALLGLVPILLGTLILSEGGALRHWMQRRDVWVGTGALLGVALAALFDPGGPVGISLIATSMLCAAIARHMVSWPALEPA